jgi:hypothetical protein
MFDKKLANCLSYCRCVGLSSTMDRFVIKTTTNVPAVDLLSHFRKAKHEELIRHADVENMQNSRKRKKVEANVLDLTFLPKPNSISTSIPLTNVQLTTISSSSAASEWAARGQNTVSSVDLACQQRLATLKAKNFTGWKINLEGSKVYTTFRNGERVAASGKEGFKLALGDGKIPSKSREKVNNKGLK